MPHAEEPRIAGGLRLGTCLIVYPFPPRNSGLLKSDPMSVIIVYDQTGSARLCLDAHSSIR